MLGFDISRWRYDPKNDAASSFVLQGSQGLDTDINDIAATFERRSRASSHDLSGLAPLEGIRGIAAVPKTTPRAFAIESDEKGAVIMPGRMYVDGLLVENHGAGGATFDPGMGETNHVDGIPESEQPYLPSAGDWPERPDWPDGKGRYLVYLVAAKREVDSILAPEQIDVAFGLETGVMMQSVWQVQTLDVDGSEQMRMHNGMPTPTRSTPDAWIPRWSEHIEPSGGRLTTRVVEPDPDDKPCELPPLGGYRGLDNQNYRVQIVKAGHVGTAEFVWSRENASVQSAVLDVVDEKTVRVANPGRDDVLCFRPGDLVQLVDEVDQLRNIDDKTKGGGFLSRVVDVDYDDGLISFEDGMAARFVKLDVGARKLRLVRWDNGKQVLDVEGIDVTKAHAGETCATRVTATKILLEHGIVVEFTEVPGGGGFVVGDYFTFAARYRDSSIEQLTDAAPSGTHRHYARLGMLVDGKFTDHRRLVPADAEPKDERCESCDLMVTQESHATGTLTISDAIWRTHGNGGGVVRICPGSYHLDKGLYLPGISNVTVRGSGPTTVIVCPEDLTVLEACSAVTFEDFTAVVGNSCSGFVVGGASSKIMLRGLTITGLAAEGKSADLRIEEQLAPADPLVAINGVVEQLEIEKCTLVGAIGIGVWSGKVANADHERRAAHIVCGISITDSVLRCSEAGVEFGASVILKTRAELSGLVVTGPTRVGVAVTGESIDDCPVEISHNSFNVSGDGVVVASGKVSVVGNDFVCRADDEQMQNTQATSAAVCIMEAGHLANSDLPMVSSVNATRGEARGDVLVSENRVREFAIGVLSVAGMQRLRVLENIVGGCGYGVAVHARGARVSIVGNSVRGLFSLSSGAVCAIAVWGASVVQVTGNNIDGSVPRSRMVGPSSPKSGGHDAATPGVDANAQWSRGISVVASSEASITENMMRNLATSEKGTTSAGIEVLGPFRAVVVSTNTVSAAAAGQRLDDPLSDKDRWQALRIERGVIDPDPDPKNPKIVSRALGQAVQEQQNFARGVFASVTSQLYETSGPDKPAVYRTITASEAGADVVEENLHLATIGVHDNDFGAFTSGLQDALPTVEIRVAVGTPDDKISAGAGAGAVRFTGNNAEGPNVSVAKYAESVGVKIVADIAAVSANTVPAGTLDVFSVPKVGLTIVGNVVGALSAPGTQWKDLNTMLWP